MADGQNFPWARMAAWMVTCPVLLNQISAMSLVKYNSMPLNTLMIAASLLRTTMGITATITPNMSLKWVFFSFGVFFFSFEMFTVFIVFYITLSDFEAIDNDLARLVVGRLKILRLILISTWTSFPILWVISSTGLCLVSENVSARKKLVCAV